jgi:hypothetical protein
MIRGAVKLPRISGHMSLNEIKSLLKKMRARVKSDYAEYDKLNAEGADSTDHFNDARYREKQFLFAKGRIIKALLPILKQLVEGGLIVTYAGSFSEVTRWMDEEKEKEINQDPDLFSVQPTIKELRMHDKYPILVLDLESVGKKKLKINVKPSGDWLN